MTQTASTVPAIKPACCNANGGAAFGALCVALRLALGGLFVFAAYNKLFILNGPQLFSASIMAFKVFDPKTQEGLIQLATFVTPWIEIISGIALILGIWTRASAVVLGLLLIGFMGLISSALSRGLNVSCGCFGKISPFCPEKIGACNIIQNSIMLAMAIAIVVCPRHVLTLESLWRRKSCCAA